MVRRILISKTPLFLCGATIILGALFRIQHWPGAFQLLLIGFLGLLVFSILNTIIKGNFKSSVMITGLFLPLFALNGLMRILNVSLSYWGTLALLGLGLAWVIFFIIRLLQQAKSRSELIMSVVYIISVLLIIIGSLFKIMHYPKASALLISGLFIGGISLVYDSFQMKK